MVEEEATEEEEEEDTTGEEATSQTKHIAVAEEEEDMTLIEEEEIGMTFKSMVAVVQAEVNLSMNMIEETQNIKNGMTIKAKEEEIERIKGIILKSMKKIRRKILKIRKGLGALQEGIDLLEKTGNIKEETLIEEITPLKEGSMLLKEGVGGSRALIEGIGPGENIPLI